MGCFDSVIFDCPHCGNEIEGQSKSGDCGMRRYAPVEVPADIAAGLIDEKIYCVNCKNYFRVVGQIPIIHLRLKLSQSDSDKNWDI